MNLTEFLIQAVASLIAIITFLIVLNVQRSMLIPGGILGMSIWLLCHCEECVINLSAMVNMSSPAVSHHLKQLKSAGLIVSRRDGKEVYYKAADTEQARNFHHMIEWLVKIACPSQVEKQKGTP